MSIAIVGALLVGALVFESRTIARALKGSSESLTRLGAGFLASEVWVIALLGFGHAAFPEHSHAIFAAAGGALWAYVVGWIVRDAALWLGPRRGGRASFRTLARLGALLQIAAVALGIVLAVLGWPGAVTEPERNGSVMTVLQISGLIGIAVVCGVALIARGPWLSPVFSWPGDGARARG